MGSNSGSRMECTRTLWRNLRKKKDGGKGSIPTKRFLFSNHLSWFTYPFVVLNKDDDQAQVPCFRCRSVEGCGGEQGKKGRLVKCCRLGKCYCEKTLHITPKRSQNNHWPLQPQKCEYNEYNETPILCPGLNLRRGSSRGQPQNPILRWSMRPSPLLS